LVRPVAGDSLVAELVAAVPVLFVELGVVEREALAIVISRIAAVSGSGGTARERD
jgi:hypothetical protein